MKLVLSSQELVEFAKKMGIQLVIDGGAGVAPEGAGEEPEAAGSPAASPATGEAPRGRGRPKKNPDAPAASGPAPAVGAPSPAGPVATTAAQGSTPFVLSDAQRQATFAAMQAYVVKRHNGDKFGLATVLKEFGVDRVSKLPPEQYAAFEARCKELTADAPASTDWD